MLRRLASFTLLSLLLSSSASPVEPSSAVERQFYVMGTAATLRVAAGSSEEARAAAGLVQSRLREVEVRWSTWQADSTASLVNTALPGRPIAVQPGFSEELARVLVLAGGLEELFRLDMGVLVGEWGLRGAGRVPEREGLSRVVSVWRGGEVVLDGNMVVRTTPSTLIEEGGFAKGLALDVALRAARASCHGLQELEVNLGGQWLLWSADANRTWQVAVADPAQRERQIGVLTVGSGSVATSGNSERGFWHEGRRYGHVLDPRTGAPSTREGACVVYAPDGLRADIASTACFVLGADAYARGAVGRNWLQSDCAVLWIEPTQASSSDRGGEATPTRMWQYRTSPGMKAKWSAYEP